MESSKVNFTKAKLNEIREAVIASGKRRSIGDVQTRCLRVDAFPSGKLTFIVRRKHLGRVQYVKVGEFGDQAHQFTIEQARRRASEILVEFNKGNNPQAAKNAQRAEPTLNVLFEEYIAEQRSAGKKTCSVMEADFKRNLVDRCCLANRKASDITSTDIKRMKDFLGNNFGTYTANRTIQLVRAIYNKTIKMKLHRGDNPAAGIALFKETERDRVLTADEVAALIRELQNEPQQDTADFIWLSLMTGIRKQNLLSMRYSEIDWNQQTWRIPETKNGKPQLVPLTQLEIEILARREREKTSDFVFPGTGKTGHLIDLKHSWTSLRIRAGLLPERPKTPGRNATPEQKRDFKKQCHAWSETVKSDGVTIHDLRRSLGSWMASQNVNVALIKGALNHKDLKTTLKVYAKTRDDAQKDARLIAHKAMLEAAGENRLLKLVTGELEPQPMQPKKRTRAKK